MCRIKMIIDESSLWCVQLRVTKVCTSQQCFTQEGYTYFLIHRTRFEFGGIVSWHKPFPSIQRVSKGCKAPRSSNDLNVGMWRNVMAAVQIMVLWFMSSCQTTLQTMDRKKVTGNIKYKTCLLPKCARAKAALFNKKQFCLAGGQIN